MAYTSKTVEQSNTITKLKKLKQFIKSLKSKVVKTKNKSENYQRKTNLPQDFPLQYSQSDSSFLVTLKPLKQSRPGNIGSEYESEYEEMTSDYCTLPRKKMKYRIKQRVFEKSLDAILLEARREIIEESSSDESEDTYVDCSQDNTYEELYFDKNFRLPQNEETIYEEI